MCSLVFVVVSTMAIFQSALAQTCSSSEGPCFTAAGTTCTLNSGATNGVCTNSADGVVCCDPTLVVAASTTGATTTTPACVDKTNPSTGVSDCAARVAAGYCTRKYYTTLMKQQCRKSCGYCSSSSSTNSTSTCADLTNARTGTSDCPRLSYLCSNSQYQSIMAVQCRKTCGLC
ncbi:unnamed protein product, partial [Mesorhabditis spiculigera]